jgi:zinc transport system permease protein
MITEALGYTFMQHAVLAAILSSVVCGIIGTLVVINRLSSLTGSVAHAAFGGLGLSYLLGTNPLLGASVFSLGSAVGIGVVQSRFPERSDTMIAALWAIGMAMGLVFIDLAPGYAVDLMSYLFGSILAVSTTDLLLMALLDIAVLAFVIPLFRHLVAVSYDAEFARARGLRVDLLILLLTCLIALSVVMLIRVTGLILVIALMTIPAATARLFLGTVRSVMLGATLVSLLVTLGGLAVSWELDLPAGAVIILLAGLVYFAAILLRRLLRKGVPPVEKLSPAAHRDSL